jgi:RNA polymerase sigma-70 factor (ECF subfamily)
MKTVMSDDISDLTAASAGDPEAFARLYERHAPVVLSLCRRCSSAGEAEDAMQEAFLRAFRRLDQLASPAGFRPWLYSIARRVCAERRRSTTRRIRHEARASQERVEMDSQTSTAADSVELDEQLDRLTVAINTLPENERLAIHLYYLEPDPPAAASSALGLSRGGYYKLLHRARQRLAILMREAQTI